MSRPNLPFRVIAGALAGLLLTLAALFQVSDAGAATDALNVKGQLYTLDLRAKTLSLKKNDDSLVTLRYNKLTPILRNGKSVKVKALLLRDTLSVKYKSNLLSTSITAEGPASRKVTGRLKDALKGNGVVVVGSYTIQTNAQTRIARNGALVSLSSLTRNDAVVAHLKPSVTESSGESEAFDLIAKGPEDGEVQGLITDITGSQVTVTPSNGAPAIVLNVTDTTMIEVDGEHAGLGDLKVGMQVEAAYDPATNDAFSIESDSEGEAYDGHISGTVAAVDLGAGLLTITPQVGDPVTLNVDASTEIEVNGEHGSLEDILVGAEVRAEYDATTLRAREIKAGNSDENDDGGGGGGDEGGDESEN